ncbi:MAG: hypothetical protein NTZ16_01870, partial [Verrucomicrobia bacterium]|nr:hypothetical protein [Verrucomicrobiota bacterium]
IGRGAFYDPWIFQRTRGYLRRSAAVPAAAASQQQGGSEFSTPPTNLRAAAGTAALPPEPVFAERVRVLCRHLDLMVEIFGEELGCRMFRKVAPWHAKRFGPANVFNKRVVRIATRAEFHAVLADFLKWRQQFLDDCGELLPRYQLPPMVASFMQPDVPVAAQRQNIPVPKGPVEVW